MFESEACGRHVALQCHEPVTVTAPFFFFPATASSILRLPTTAIRGFLAFLFLMEMLSFTPKNNTGPFQGPNELERSAHPRARYFSRIVQLQNVCVLLLHEENAYSGESGRALVSGFPIIPEGKMRYSCRLLPQLMIPC